MPQDYADEPSKNSPLRLARIGLVFLPPCLLLLVVAVMILPGTEPPTPPPSPTSAKAKVGLAPGEIGEVFVPGGGTVWVITDSARQELTEALAKQDQEHLGELTKSRKGALIFEGTRVRVTGDDESSYKVRVLDGASTDFEGWIDRMMVRKARPASGSPTPTKS